MAVQSPPSSWLNITDLRRGRNGSDPPHSISDNECVDAVNVDWYKALIGRKRGGATALSMTGSTFTGTISALGRHTPTSNSSETELWGVDDAATPIINRLAGGTTWAAPTLKDVPTGNGWDFSMASSGGKFFLAHKSGVNRLHCWDGSTVRRTGLPAPAAPAVANTGGGAYFSIPRYYRVRWTVQVGGITTRRSEPSASTAFTPSGVGTAARVTEPAAASEAETHWEVEVSLNNSNFFVLATVVVGTTTYDDSAATSTYASGTTSPSIGLYTVQPSYKFVAVDQNRVLGFGSHTATDKQNRIEISDILGGFNISDNERVPLNSYVDLDENDSGAATGLVGPVLGSYFAFKETQLWKLTPSGIVATPYTQSPISKSIGCAGPHAMSIGEDEYGNPAIYWISQTGIYRYGSGGLEFIGGGVSDLVIGPTSTINLAATKVIGHVEYYPRLRQVWFWLSVGNENEPQSTILVYNLGRYGGFLAPTTTQFPSGWSRFTGNITKARASVMFSDTVGVTMSRETRPYIAYSGAANKIWKLDTVATTDDGTAFQAYVTSKAFAPWAPKAGYIGRSYVLAKALSGVTITQTLISNMGEETSVGDTVSLTPIGLETWVYPRFEDSRSADLDFLQVTLGDAAAIASGSWQIDESAIEWFGRQVD